MKRFVLTALAALAAVTTAGASGQSNPISRADEITAGSHAALVGTITGRVTETGSGRPLVSVQVSIDGSTLGALTDAQGRYTIPNVPAGDVRLLATRIGYAQLQRTVTVRDGATATADFQMTETAVLLNEVVVTGTAGGTQRRAIGNVVTTVNADRFGPGAGRQHRPDRRLCARPA